jgi:hypothetical protein
MSSSQPLREAFALAGSEMRKRPSSFLPRVLLAGLLGSVGLPMLLSVSLVRLDLLLHSIGL